MTLLLWNAVAMEALPIFLNHLVSPFYSILLSVTLVLLFGEIIPQAICNKFGLAVGAHPARTPPRLPRWGGAPTFWPG